MKSEASSFTYQSMRRLIDRLDYIRFAIPWTEKSANEKVSILNAPKYDKVLTEPTKLHWSEGKLKLQVFSE